MDRQKVQRQIAEARSRARDARNYAAFFGSLTITNIVANQVEPFTPRSVAGYADLAFSFITGVAAIYEGIQSVHQGQTAAALGIIEAQDDAQGIQTSTMSEHLAPSTSEPSKS